MQSQEDTSLAPVLLQFLQCCLPQASWLSAAIFSIASLPCSCLLTLGCTPGHYETMGCACVTTCCACQVVYCDCEATCCACEAQHAVFVRQHAVHVTQHAYVTRCCACERMCCACERMCCDLQCRIRCRSAHTFSAACLRRALLPALRKCWRPPTGVTWTWKASGIRSAARAKP